MRRLVLGILAHVDSGKTTLSESILYECGTIRKLGRVDNQDAFLDTYSLEKERGITIFSKQAVFSLKDIEITLLDTPGHVDFSAEMERALQVLDFAVLVVSAADGVQGHTEVLWRLLKQYDIPAFIFVNKMDQVGADKELVLKNIKERLSDTCIDFTNWQNDEIQEEIAMCDEALMEQYLEGESVTVSQVSACIAKRACFPVYFGSALKLQGIDEFIEGLYSFMKEKIYQDEFGAKIFNISRDDQGNRLTFLKVTGGTLKVRSMIEEEKINQLRVYSGTKFTLVDEATPGMVVAATGLTKTHPGQGLGAEQSSPMPVLEAVLTYSVILPKECDPMLWLGKLKQLEDEEPEIQFTWKERTGEIQAKLMGEVQLEILQQMVKDRFQIVIEFGESQIVYKETVANTVEGVGHFEPLRHYAEAHVRIEPGEPGSGITTSVDCSEDDLSKNWQRLILTHLQEKQFSGVLTGSELTDVKFVLVGGKAHPKHTEGGDFRQATYRAVRQGLMQASNVLLEPMYSYELEVPSEMIGRAISDMEKMSGSFEGPEQRGEMSVLTGVVPVATMQNYQKELTAYTKGRGRLLTNFHGYAPCHNAEEIIEAYHYDPEQDVDNPSASVFCAHGSGFLVSWDQVFSYMHVPLASEEKKVSVKDLDITGYHANQFQKKEEPQKDFFATEKELQEIFEKTYGAVKRELPKPGQTIFSKPKKEKPYVYKERVKKPEYLLVDGYNIIFAWEALQSLAKVDLGAARTKLMDILSNYQGFKKVNVILVFDAYRLEGHPCEVVPYHNITVVYTKEAETADRYIERAAHEMGKQYDVTVATSDGIEQIIITGAGCRLISAREFEKEVLYQEEVIRTDYLENQKTGKRYLFDDISESVSSYLNAIKNEDDQ